MSIAAASIMVSIVQRLQELVEAKRPQSSWTTLTGQAVGWRPELPNANIDVGPTFVASCAKLIDKDYEQLKGEIISPA